jgi:hypothetical protein
LLSDRYLFHFIVQVGQQGVNFCGISDVCLRVTLDLVTERG